MRNGVVAMCVGITMCLSMAVCAKTASVDRPTQLIGYCELQTNLPGGRFANISTMRACVVRADGTGRRMLANTLIKKPGSWTQFAGWSPDGKKAILLSAWESAENATWEEEHKQFRQMDGAYLVDSCLMDLASGKIFNPTAVERVSCYNTGLFFWPKDPNRFGFQAMIGDESHPFSMNRDGTGKTDLSRGVGFTYGFSSSPDGKRVAYHKDYQLYVADADGSNPVKIETGNPFNFGPSWSPDGKWLLFVSGEHYNCHPFVVKSDGTGLRKIADRGGYKGYTLILDVPDYHDGSSDGEIWSPDSKWIYYTAKVGESIELMRVSMDGKTEQLSKSAAGVSHYHPKLSPDGKWLLFGANKNGMRQLYVSRANGTDARPITRGRKGYASIFASWQPKVAPATAK